MLEVVIAQILHWHSLITMSPRGYVYADSSNTIGFLNHKRSWRLRILENVNYIYGNVYSPNMYFYEGTPRKWTGDKETSW